jgi:hypothetical protein
VVPLEKKSLIQLNFRGAEVGHGSAHHNPSTQQIKSRRIRV